MSVLFTFVDGRRLLREVKGWTEDEDGLLLPMIAGRRTMLTPDLFSMSFSTDVADWELVEGSVGSALDQAFGIDEAHEALAEDLPPMRGVVPSPTAEVVITRLRAVLDDPFVGHVAQDQILAAIRELESLSPDAS